MANQDQVRPTIDAKYLNDMSQRYAHEQRVWEAVLAIMNPYLRDGNFSPEGICHDAERIVAEFEKRMKEQKDNG